jgi:hypothetical protein
LTVPPIPLYQEQQMQRNTANFANSAAIAGAFLEAPTSLFANIFSAVNEADKLRWVCIAPYGDWPNSQGMQRIQKSDAVKMVNEFNSLLGTPQRMLGLPWYVGHPDHPAFANKYKDTAAKGRIKKLEARDDGLYAGVKLNETGEKILTNEEFEGHSVNWYLKEDPKAKNVWRPFRVKSVGWTNEPNIPVPTMTTANEDANGNIPLVFANGTELQHAHFMKIAAWRAMANIIMANGDSAGHPLANHFAGRLSRTNPQFNHAAFVKAASGEGYSFRSRTPLSKLARNPLDDGIAHEPKTGEADSLYAASKHGANERYASIAQFRTLGI